MLPSTRIQVHAAADVRRRGVEHDPQAVGLPKGFQERIWASVERLYATGLHPAIGLCIRRRGEVVLDRTIGHSHGNAPGQSQATQKAVASPSTLFNLFSASKVLTGMLLVLLDERGALQLDRPVQHYLPAFGANGKKDITLRDLLLHRAGMDRMPQDLEPEQALSCPDAVIERLCTMPPRKNSRIHYHPLSGALILSRCVEIATGRDLRQLANENILGPLGFRNMNYGVAADQIDAVAHHAFTGPELPGVVADKFRETAGVGHHQAIELSNQPGFLTAILPSANVIATPRETTRFFELLRNDGELDGVRIFKRGKLRQALKTRTRLALDGTFGFPIRYGPGVMLGGRRFSLFGLGTPHAFGHLGFTNVVCYADPSRELSVAFLNTGKPFVSPRMLRWYEVLQRIALETRS